MNKLILLFDESGNSGEVVIKKNVLSELRDQPYFALGSIGVMADKLSMISDTVKQMTKEHNIRLKELKTSKLYSKKPLFIYNLLQHLLSNQHPLFVELMDKKYYLVVQITNSCIFPISSGLPFDDKLIFSLQGCAEYLYYKLPNEAFSLFCRACRESSRKSFELVLNYLKNFMEHTNDGIGSFLLMHVNSTICDFHDFKQEEAYKKFLPLPDYGKRSEIISLLPHTHAFLNICARAQKYCSETDIRAVQIIHDEQHYFDEIIKTNLETLRKVKLNIELPDHVTERADFLIKYDVDIFFDSSKDNIWLQIADIIAGTTIRIWRDFRNRKSKDKILCKIVEDILFSYTDLHPSLGINFVTSKSELEEFQNWIMR